MRQKRSAKQIIEQYAYEVMNRTNDKDTDTKLLVVETIALRMNWNDLYNRIRFRKKPQYYWSDKD